MNIIKLTELVLRGLISYTPRRTWPHRYFRTRREIKSQSDQLVNWQWQTMLRKTNQVWPEEK